MITKILMLVFISILVVLFFIFDLQQYLTLEQIQIHKEQINVVYEANTFFILLAFFLIYVLVAALSLPGAAILTIAAGAFFNFFVGLILVSFASSIGATLAFLISRFLLRNAIEKKFFQTLTTINNGLEKDGAFYLFSLRLVPLFPFFIINLVMGLTKLKVKTFYWVSQLGMLLGTAVYVNAGTQISQLESTADILSPALLISFALLGLFPLISKKIIEVIKKKTVKR